MSTEVSRLCDEIKSKYSLTEYVESKGIVIGKGGFFSCVFHQEQTPSCRINSGKGSEWFYCHGCHASGTIIDFYARMEGVSIGKAIHELSKGIDFTFNLEDIQRELAKEDVIDEKDYFSEMNTMISVHCFRYLRKILKECGQEVFEKEFLKIDKMFSKLDESIREFDKGRVSELYKKICVEDFLTKRFRDLKENEHTD